MIPRHIAFVAFPPLAGLLMGALAYISPFIIRAVLVGLGVASVSYIGIDAGLSALQAEVANQFGGLSSDVVAIVGLTKIDQAATVVMSAIAYRISFNVTAGAVTKLSFGKRA